MEKNQKDLNDPSPSEFCGDGSCGCGCGGVVEIKEIFSQEEILETRSSGEESVELTGNPAERKEA